MKKFQLVKMLFIEIKLPKFWKGKSVKNSLKLHIPKNKLPRKKQHVY